MPTPKKNLDAKTRQWPQQMAALLKACADQTRLRLLYLMAREGEVCVCHLVDVLGANQPKVSRHLAYLKRAGLVNDRKDGLWVHYRLNEALSEHARRILDCLNDCCGEAEAMQSDITKLRKVCAAQPIVKLTSRAATSTAAAKEAMAKPDVRKPAST